MTKKDQKFLLSNTLTYSCDINDRRALKIYKHALTVVDKQYEIQWSEEQIDQEVIFTVACTKNNFAAAYMTLGLMIATMLERNK